MIGPSYPAARAVAERIEARLATNTVAFQHPDDAPKPDAVAIEEIISVAFWASLRREEGKFPTISLAFFPPKQSVAPLLFKPRLMLEPQVLARLAPAVERPGIHLGVWWFDDELCLWGTTRSIPMWCFVLEVIRPGLLVVKYRRAEPSMKFGNIAVLEGADVKLIEQQELIISEAPPALTALLAFYASAGRHQSDDILVRLAVSMRAHGRGGTLLVVPRHSEEWRKSILQPTTYAVTPFSEIGPLLEKCHETGSDASPEAIRSAVDALAGLTAVDGATVISDHFELLGFGVKIVSQPAMPLVEEVLLTEPIKDVPNKVTHISKLGGTRHLSAAQFVFEQRDAVALVASQDDRFTVFAWSPLNNLVHAHRMEALLM